MGGALRGRTVGLAAIAAAGLAALGFALYRERPLPLPPGTGVAVRGQNEADLTPQGELVPVFVGRERKVGLCFSPPPEVDTSRWSARFSVAGTPLGAGSAGPPGVRMESTLCFDAPPPARPPRGPVELCGVVRTGAERDGGPELSPVCRRVRFVPELPQLAALKTDAYALLARSSEEALPAWLADLDALVARIERAGFPLYAVQVEMVGINVSRRAGTPEALRAARRRLAALPPWLERPEASWSAGQAAQEAAALELADGVHLERAWSELRRADERYLRIASSYRFTVTVKQADILALVGASREAAERLRAALAGCERAPCDPYLLPSAHGELAWLILLDPDAPAAELQEAEALLRKALASPQAQGDRRENVNWLVNLAYLEVRAGRSPAGSLQQVRALLGAGRSGWEGVLRGWSDLVEGWGALQEGEAARALALCNRWTGAGASPQLAAQALSCAGAAYRSEGERERALWSLEQAILLYEEAGPAQLGQRLPLGPGQRADDYYEAVRLALDLGEPQRAWELLERLDGLAANEEEERLCRERERDPARARLRAATASERDRLLARVLALDLPASGERRRQLETVRRGLKEKLQELARQSLPCAAPVPSPVRPAAFRAVPLRDEILLLHRGADGGVALDHRTPFDRRELRRTVERLGEELERRTLPDAEWRELLAPLAAALLPRERRELRGVVLYALHGPLQGVPLAALPVSGTGGSGGAWLSDLATVAVLPAGLRPAPGESAASPAAGAAPLFVVDPRGDLPGGGDLAGFYARSFPGARVLRGEAAARRPFREELRHATLLHLDTHGLYDPAFPELSSLLLADGPLTLSELADLPVPRGLVNLSGCRTGEWPVTADSGQYGLAGLFARRGAAWVVASRSDLDDEVAGEFNRAFYTEMKGGRGVVESYARALAEVRRRRPAASWGGLILLPGAAALPDPAPGAGKSAHPRYSLGETGGTGREAGGAGGREGGRGPAGPGRRPGMNPIDDETYLRELAQIEEEEGGAAPSDQLLAAYREGRLGPEEAERLEDLLAGRPEARERLAALAGVTLPRPAARIRAAVLAAAPRKRRAIGINRGTWAAAAGVLLAAAALVFRLQGGGSPGEPLPAYEVALTGIAAERSAPAPATQAVTARPETRITISAEPAGQGVPGVDFGIYRRSGDRLERIAAEGAVRLVENGGAAELEAPARELVGTDPGEHPLYVVVAPRGDLPEGGRLASGEDAATRLGAGGRRRVYTLHVTLLSSR